MMTATAAELSPVIMNLRPDNSNNREKFQGVDMKSRGRNAIGKNKANAPRATSGAATMKTGVGGKIEALEVPEGRLNKRNTMKLWKKSKPPLNVREHSSGNRITVTSWPRALTETVE